MAKTGEDYRRYETAARGMAKSAETDSERDYFEGRADLHSTRALLAELASHGYSGAVNILLGEGFGEAEAAEGVLGAIPRTVEEQIRAKLAR